MGSPQERETTPITREPASEVSEGRRGEINLAFTFVATSQLAVLGLESLRSIDLSNLIKTFCHPGEIPILLETNEYGQPQITIEELVVRGILEGIGECWNKEAAVHQGLPSSIAAYCRKLKEDGQTPETIAQVLRQRFPHLPDDIFIVNVKPGEPKSNTQGKESASGFLARLFEKACDKRPEMGKTIPVETHPLNMSARTRAKFSFKSAAELGGELPGE